MINQQNKVDELCSLVERVMDAAMGEGRFLMKVYPLLEAQKFTRREVTEFIESSTAASVSEMCLELEGYIKGGDPYLRESFGHIPKPQARKIHKYLYALLEDAWKYEQTRRPGRKKKSK